MAIKKALSSSSFSIYLKDETSMPIRSPIYTRGSVETSWCTMVSFVAESWIGSATGWKFKRGRKSEVVRALHPRQQVASLFSQARLNLTASSFPASENTDRPRNGSWVGGGEHKDMRIRSSRADMCSVSKPHSGFPLARW